MKKTRGKILVATLLFVTVLLALGITALAGLHSDTDFVYAVTGGNIYFDKSTGTITDCDDTVTAVDIPPEIDGVAVTGIGSNAFENCTGLTSMDIPDSVTSIKSSAFYGCSSLTNITIPESVTSLSPISTFRNCSSLTSITIPDGVTEIGYQMFQGCSSLTNVTLPDSLTGLGYFTFKGCSSLTSITIPDSVTDFGGETFLGCSSLTSITIPDGVTYIRDGVFNGCSSLTSITIPDGVTGIDKWAFCNCSNLTSVTIPDSVTIIWDTAFFGCNALSDVYYSGTKTQWEKIEIRSENEPLTSATIHFAEALSITVQPGDAAVTAGKNASFSVTVSGDVQKYQWQYSTSGKTWKNVGTSVSGSTSDAMTFKAVAKYNNYQYRCVVTDAYGNSVTSESAKLTVTTAAPKITTQPKDVTASVGGEAVFSVTASGTSLKYQWQYSKNGTAWYNVGTSISGSRTAAMSFTAVKKYNGYFYRCKITDGAGNTVLSAAAKLTVSTASVKITAQPQNVSVKSGREAAFSVAATGSALTYQWQYSTDGSMWKNVGTGIKSAKTEELYFTAVAKYNGYAYRCRITDAGGAVVYSDAATLTVK